MSHFSSTGWSWGCSFLLGRGPVSTEGLRSPGFTQLCTQHPLTWWIDLEQVEGVLVFLLHIRVLVWKKFPSETMISGSRSSLLTHFQKASLSWCCNLRACGAQRAVPLTAGVSQAAMSLSSAGRTGPAAPGASRAPVELEGWSFLLNLWYNFLNSHRSNLGRFTSWEVKK